MDGINGLALARALHVLGVVIWIGGVAFVTLVLLPACAEEPEPSRALALFERLEHRFAPLARWSVALAGLSGLWLLHVTGAAWRFSGPLAQWWMYGMVGVWSVFALMLYVLEPFVLRTRFAALAHAHPAATLARVQRLHRVLLLVSLVVLGGAVAGSHGGLLA